LVRALADRNTPVALAELDAAIASGVEVGLLLDQLVGYMRDVMALSVGCKADQLLYALPSQAAEVAEIGQRLGIATVLAIGQILDQTSARMRVSVHGRTLVEMAIVRICQLGELDELSSLIAELRGMPTEASTGGVEGTKQLRATTAPAVGMSQVTPAPKKNAEPAAPSLAQGLASAVSSAIASAPPRVAPPAPPASVATVVVNNRANGVASSGEEVLVNDLLAESAESPASNAPAGESVLAQFQRAVKQGTASRTEAPSPRKSQREKLAEVAEQPFVKRAMEMFDVEPGQFRYSPPEGEST
jgi:DNA polymerase-3 subunit gamma/tau